METAPSHPKLEARIEKEQIIKSAQWEDFRYGETPIAGAVANWGVEMTNRDIADMFHLPPAKEPETGLEIPADQVMEGSTGFRTRFSYPFGTTKAEAVYIEEQVGTALIKRACANRGIDPQDLAAIYIANTFPGNGEEKEDLFGENIARAAGADQELVMNLSLACNGFVEGLRLVAERQEELRGKYVLVGSVEGLTKMRGTVPDLGDSQTFTNSGSAVVFKVGEDFEMNPGTFRVIEDDENYPPITGPCTYTYDEEYMTSEFGGPLMVTSHARRQMLRNRDGENFAHMNPEATSRWGLRIVPDVLTEEVRRLVPDIGDSYPDFLYIGHQPNYIMHRGVVGRGLGNAANNKSIQRDFDLINRIAPWIVKDGNASSATTGKALLRAAKNGMIRKGKPVFIFGYGVGSNFSSLLLEINSTVSGNPSDQAFS